MLIAKLDNFFTKFKHQKYKKGEILIRADDDPAGIFYLKEGFVKSYLISKKGDELVLNIFRPIAFFPMSWAINNTKNIYFYEAMTSLELWKAPKEKVLEFIRKEHDVAYDLLSRVYKGTDGLLTRMSYLMSGNAYARLIIELLIHGKRFGNKSKEFSSIEVKVSEKDLAAQAGMTRETVSREIKTLKDKGIVVFHKNGLLIKDLNKLEEEILEGV